MNYLNNDVLSISEIINRVAWLIDHERAECAAEHFTATASIEFGDKAPNPGIVTDVPNFFSQRQKNTDLMTRHITSNISINVRNSYQADALYTMTVYRTSRNEPDLISTFIADVEEKYEKSEENGWQINYRLTNPIFLFKVSATGASG